MVLGPPKDDTLKKNLDVQGGGQSRGVPAAGQVEGNAVNPMGPPEDNPGVNHWQATNTAAWTSAATSSSQRSR